MEEASAYCQHPDNNALLVEIWSELQLDFIIDEMVFLQDNGVSNDWWTGATDLGREGSWYWARSLATVGDFIWLEGNPNAGLNGNCAELQDQYSFFADDVSCSVGRFFICQKK